MSNFYRVFQRSAIASEKDAIDWQLKRKRDTGVEPVSQPWEGWAQPIYQSRENSTQSSSRPGRVQAQGLLEEVQPRRVGNKVQFSMELNWRPKREAKEFPRWRFGLRSATDDCQRVFCFRADL